MSCMKGSAMKTSVLFTFLVLLSAIQSSKAQRVSCFVGAGCSGLSLDESLTFDRCCLELGYQSYLTSSGECSDCSSAIVEFSEVSYSVGEGDEFVILEMVRFSDPSNEMVVAITLRETGREDSARGGFDFGFFPEEEITFTTVFLVNETSMRYGVRINDDNIVEANETFRAFLSLPSEEDLNRLGYDSNPNPDNLKIGRRGGTTVYILDNDFVNITLSPGFFEQAESEVNRPIEFVLRKEGPSERAVEVIAFTRNASNPVFTAVDDLDYVGLEETVFRFESNDFEMRFSVRLLDDSVVEYDELFAAVVLPGEDERGVNFPAGQVSTVRILDDNDFVQFLFQPMEYTVREDEGSPSLTVVQVGDSERPVAFSMAVNVQGTNATNGTDFIFTFKDVVITNEVSIRSRIISSGETLNFHPIDIIKDGRYELDEVIQVDLFPAEGESSVQTGPPATIIIEDSDVVSIGFLESAIVVDEPSSFAVSVVLLENNLDPGTAISLGIRAMDGVATEGDDYLFSYNSTEFSFTPDGESTLAVSVEIIDDDVFEGREDFTFILSSEQPRVIFTSEQTIEITDNEDLLIEFNMSVYDVSEIDGILSFQIELISMIEREIQLLLNTSDGRATGGEDYEPVSQILTFRPNSRIVNSDVILYDDDINEGLEEFTLQLILTDQQLGRPGILRESTVRIIDNEVTFVEFSSDSYTVSEGENFVVLKINKTGVTQEAVPVIVNLNDGTARAGDQFDYGPFNSPTLSVMARLFPEEVSIPFGVIIREDKRVEYDESFTATLTLPQIDGSNVQLGSMRNTTVIIKDNDKINVTISPGYQEVVESTNQLTFTISGSDDLILDRNVIVMVSAVPDTALADSDFRANEMALTFTESGPRSFVYTIQILQDNIAEGPEQLTVRLFTLPGETGVAFHTSASIVRIVDDDVALVEFSKNLFEGDEIDGAVEVCLSKDVETASGFEVTLLPQETIPSPPDTFQARAGIDFEASPVSVSFAADDTIACGRITIINDNQVGETREVFAVRLRLPEDIPYIDLGPVEIATVEVTDTPDVLFGFERSTLEVSEALGEIDICVVVFNPGRDDPLDATIDFKIESFSNTADSTDYQLIGADSGTISNSTREVCFSVKIVDDMLLEDTLEFFSLIIDSVDVIGTSEDGRMLRVLDSPNRIDISIADNDGSVVIGFQATDYTVEEENGRLELCVEVSRPTSREEFDAIINITVATIAGSAGPSDYVPISAIDGDVVLEFDNLTRLRCFDVEIIEDSIFEGDEQFTVQLTVDAVNFNGAPQSISLPNATATITIVEISTLLLVGFEEESLNRRVPQNGETISLCVVVVGSREITANFSVSVAFNGGTADPQLDFLLERDLILSFDNITRRRCFDVQIISDDDENDEYFEIRVILIQFFPGIQIDNAREIARITIIAMTPPPPTTPPIVVNDTVIGDPLFTVPLNVNNGFNLLPARAKAIDGFPNLCYEIHGEHDRHFNLVSDTCTTVNAHYTTSDSPDLLGLNVISTIGIRAVNSRQRCVNINIGVENDCMPTITEDGLSAIVSPRYQVAGITVSKHRNQVRVSVPNCRNIQLVMWISCQSLSSFPMIRYDITRGINLRPTSHGLIGQFWNVPISISRYSYSGIQEIDYLDLDSLYAVTVTPPLGARNRTFIAELYTFTWEPRNEVCFYAGNIQGGSLREITDRNFNDPVIEGSYVDYIVDGPFEHDFAYSRFSADMC